MSDHGCKIFTDTKFAFYWVLIQSAKNEFLFTLFHTAGFSKLLPKVWWAFNVDCSFRSSFAIKLIYNSEDKLPETILSIGSSKVEVLSILQQIYSIRQTLEQAMICVRTSVLTIEMVVRYSLYLVSPHWDSVHIYAENFSITHHIDGRLFLDHRPFQCHMT